MLFFYHFFYLFIIMELVDRKISPINFNCRELIGLYNIPDVRLSLNV